MITTVSIKNTGDAWAAHKRYKVNNAVSFSGVIYQNKTGINSEPYDGSPNWHVVYKAPDAAAIIIANGNPFNLIKHPANNTPGNELVLEENDFIVSGFWDNVTFFNQAQYQNGDKNQKTSYKILDQIENL